MGVGMAADRYQITVAGKTFLVGSEQGETHVRTVADYVEKRMQEVAKIVTTADSARIAIMTAMALADELLELSEHRNCFSNNTV
jgi:cell division protein ZapA (FtsZ GTPase activity inhibitor)